MPFNVSNLQKTSRTSDNFIFGCIGKELYRWPAYLALRQLTGSKLLKQHH